MMTLERFEDLAEAYGGEIARWPEGERETARALLAVNAARLAPVLSAAAQMDRLLDLAPAQSADATLLGRLVAAAPRAPDTARRWLAGLGAALDDWRIEQLWALFEPGVQYRNDSKVCSEWWTLWRRVAGGLPQTAQLRLLDDFALILDNNKDEIRKRAIPPVKGSEDDMVRLAASLERAPANYKLEIGNWLMSQIARGSGDQQRHLWAIGRLGARQPFYGSAHDVIPAEQVADWLFTLLEQDWKKLEPAAFAAAHLSRRSGDRNRDMPDEIREVVIERLQASKLAPAWAQMVSDVVELDNASVQQALSESLPPGLKLLG